MLINITCFFRCWHSSGVRVSAFAITGIMLTLSCKRLINSTSRGFNPWPDGAIKYKHVCTCQDKEKKRQWDYAHYSCTSIIFNWEMIEPKILLDIPTNAVLSKTGQCCKIVRIMVMQNKKTISYPGITNWCSIYSWFTIKVFLVFWFHVVYDWLPTEDEIERIITKFYNTYPTYNIH